MAPRKAVARRKQTDALMRRQQFIKAYLTPGPGYFNAGKAAILSGYSGKSIHGARVRGHEMLKEPAVQQALAAYTEEANRETKLSQEELFLELRSVARSDLRRFYDSDGALLSPHQWTYEMAAAVSSVEVTETRDAKGKVTGQTSKIKLWNKLDAIDKAMRHLGLFEKDNRQKEENLVVQVNLVGPPRTLEPVAPSGVVIRPNLLGSK